MFYQQRVRLAELAAKTRLPAMWGLRDHAEVGGLMAYSSDVNDLARRAATFVDKILKGAKPADLPVEQPTRFESSTSRPRRCWASRSRRRYSCGQIR